MREGRRREEQGRAGKSREEKVQRQGGGVIEELAILELTASMPL